MIRSSNARLHRNASVCCAATVTALSRLTNASLLFTARSCSVQFLGTSLFIQRCTGCLPSVAVHDLGVLSSHYESNGHDSAGQGRAGQGEGDSNQLQIRSDCWGRLSTESSHQPRSEVIHRNTVSHLLVVLMRRCVFVCFHELLSAAGRSGFVPAVCLSRVPSLRFGPGGVAPPGSDAMWGAMWCNCG